MCTAATYKTKDFYFGRTLDHECSYSSKIGSNSNKKFLTKAKSAAIIRMFENELNEGRVL